MYLHVFFTKGVVFEDIFLKKMVSQEGTTQFEGTYNGDKIRITVEGQKDKDKESILTFELLYDTSIYTVKFDNATNWKASNFVVLNENDFIIFEGRYDEFGYIVDKNGDYLFDPTIIAYSGGERLRKHTDISVSTILHYATAYDSLQIRGNPYLLSFAIIILIFTFIDYCFPTLFFTLNHFLSVRDPEPSDFYEMVQHFFG